MTAADRLTKQLQAPSSVMGGDATIIDIKDIAEVLGELRAANAEIARIRRCAKHERDIGAEAVLLQARSMANVELSEENDRLIEALRDAYVLIDNDLVGPWIARHQLDWLTANNKSM